MPERERQRWDRAIAIAILAIIASGVVTMAARDEFFVRRCPSSRTSCIANLKMIDGAKATWALDLKRQDSAVPNDQDLFGETLYVREKPQCPQGGIYTLGRVDQKPRCSVRGHTF